MNIDVFEGRWRQMRGELRSWWGRLSDNDLERIEGKKDRLIGMLQEKYGYTREAAQQEMDRRFRDYDERTRPVSQTDMPGKTEDGRSDPSAAQPMSAVGERIGSLADA